MMMERSKVMRAACLPCTFLLLAMVRAGSGEATSIEDQDLRVKRNSETGLVDKTGEMEMVVGEEERSVVGCGEVLLVCPSTTMIVVRSASFTPLGEGSRPAACTTRGLGGNNQAIWRAVVDACSGSRKGKCTFSLEEHLRESKAWGLGRTEVRYTCVANLHSYCGGRVEAGGGPGCLATSVSGEPALMVVRTVL